MEQHLECTFLFGVVEKFVCDDSDDERDITIDELKLLLSKYEELDRLVEKITEEINIKYQEVV